MDFQLKTAAFSPNGRIPDVYTCEGEDMPPPLAWSGAPAGTASFALIVDRPPLRWAVSMVGCVKEGGSLAGNVSASSLSSRLSRSRGRVRDFQGPGIPSKTGRRNAAKNAGRPDSLGVGMLLGPGRADF
jgi:hypothetical protein